MLFFDCRNVTLWLLVSYYLIWWWKTQKVFATECRLQKIKLQQFQKFAINSFWREKFFLRIKNTFQLFENLTKLFCRKKHNFVIPGSMYQVPTYFGRHYLVCTYLHQVPTYVKQPLYKSLAVNEYLNTSENTRNTTWIYLVDLWTVKKLSLRK